MSGFVIGQRWISESEPELGLATVVHTGKGRVQVEFGGREMIDDKEEFRIQ